MKHLALSAGLVLVACQAPGPEVTAPRSEAAAAPLAHSASFEAPETLVGQYRVAGIDGSEVAGGIGIALTVTERLLAFEPSCAGFSWTYTYADGALATDRPQKPPAPGAAPTARRVAPVCRIAVHPEQARLARALDAVTQARRTPSNAIELTGGGHSVTLYSQ